MYLPMLLVAIAGLAAASTSSNLMRRGSAPSAAGALTSPLRIMPFGDSITVFECAANGYQSAADHAIFGPLNETSGQNDQGTGYPYPNGTFFVTAHGGYRGFLGHALADDEGGAIGPAPSSPAWTFVGSQFDCGNHEGYGGETVGWLANRTTAIMSNAQPDIVLFMAGTNDFFWPVNDAHHGCRTAACLAARLRKLLDLTFAAVPKTTFLLSTITHINEARCKFYDTAHWHPGNCPDDMQANIIAYNKLLPAIAAEYVAKGFDMAVHDVNEEAQFVDADYWIWGIHFNATGFRKMANVWANAISSSAKWKGRAAAVCPCPARQPVPSCCVQRDAPPPTPPTPPPAPWPSIIVPGLPDDTTPTTIATERPATAVATCVNVSDCTAELQAVLDSCAETVTVPALPSGRSWIVRPISVTCDGQTIDFDAEAVLQAKRGEFHQGQGGTILFKIQNRSDVTVRGHGGATFRMWREDYGNPKLYSHSEGRHGMAIYGSRNVLLDGLTVTETGGDGVYVSNILGQLGTPNRNVSILNCNLTGNYRNAISVISVAGLRVENTVLAMSKGTPPEGGLDIEPNSPENLLEDILLDNVTMFGNTLRSLTLSAHAARNDSTYAPISITVRNTVISGGSFGISINTGPQGVPAGSTMVLDNLRVENTSGAGLLLEDKHKNLAVTVKDSIFRGVAAQANHPIWIEGHQNAPCDGASFDNVTVVDGVFRTAVVFTADVVNVAGLISVQNARCCGAGKWTCPPQTVPEGNSLVISSCGSLGV